MKAVVLDPDNHFNVDRQLTKDDVQKLIRVCLILSDNFFINSKFSMLNNFKLCVDRLLDVRSPSLDTIKMQVYFDMNYTTRSN